MLEVRSVLDVAEKGEGVTEVAIIGSGDLHADNLGGRRKGRKFQQRTAVQGHGVGGSLERGCDRYEHWQVPAQKKTPATQLPVLNFAKVCGRQGAGKGTGESDSVAR